MTNETIWADLEPIGTARVNAGPTLASDVTVLRIFEGGMFAEVTTTGNGTGGWARPGKRLVVRTSIMSGFVPVASQPEPPAAVTDPEPVASPAPLSAPIDGNDYITLLLARQAAWQAAHPHVHLSPLLEWFIEPGDEQWVRLPGPTPKPTPVPRTYRPAADIRAELAQVEATMQRIADSGPDDPASVNLSPYSRSRAARNAGRRRFAQLDRDLERYGRLARRRDRLASQLVSAQAREARAAE